MTGDPHPGSQLNDTVHQRVRLSILSILAESSDADFRYLQSTLELTNGNLGRHLEVLAEEGLVTIDKGFASRRPRTRVTISDAGRAALAAEIAALKQIVERFERAEAMAREGSRGTASIVPNTGIVAT